MPECSISGDWMQATVIEPAAPFAYAGDVLLGEGLRDVDRRREFGPHTTTGPVTNWRMREVTLVPSHGLAFKDGQLVEQTRYGPFPDSYSGEERAAQESLAGPHRRLDQRRIYSGLYRFAANHYHVLAQIVPAIAAYRTEPDFLDGILLLARPDAMVSRALELAGIEVPQTMIAGPLPLDIDDLTVSSLLSFPHQPSLFCRSVYDRMIERVPMPAGRSGPRLIYVSRADAKTRPMRNENELIRMLARYDVEPVVLSTLSLDQQIALFRNARLVIGPHGAGLANVVFSAPNTVLYELLADHRINSCMNRLAQLRGVHYWCDVHMGEDRHGLWPWTVDLAAVERRLRDLRSVYDLWTTA